MTRLTRLLSTSTIRPASGDRHADVDRRIELTRCDHQLLCFPYINRGLVFNKPKENPVEHLKATLSQALDRLYPLAGRLVATEHDGDTNAVSFHVECNGAGALFVHAEAVNNIKVADILDPFVVPTEIIDSFFPLAIRVSNYHATGLDLPLLAVQVTELVDGVFVAVSINHGIADGKTYWDFFNIWSELSRGDSAAVLRRGGFVFGRECFDGVADFPIRIPFYPIKPPLIGSFPSPPPLQQRVFRFLKDKIAALKVKANARSGTEREISSLQALMAHLWVCITRSRDLRDEDEVCYTMAVDMRSRLQPPLPQSYAGNAILIPGVTCTAGELLGNGMGWAARRINDVINGHAKMGTGEFYDACMSPLMRKRSPGMLIMGGSPRFDVYGIDFGWGRPLLHRIGLAGTTPGLLNVSPGPVQGSVDFEATLSPETFRALARDPEFADYSSSL